MAEINNLVVAEKSDLVAIANAIRAKSGNTEGMKFPHDFISGIEGIVSGGSGEGSGMDGLEQGYDVMFYDEHGEELAFYSVKQGHSVDAPNYECISWVTSDNATVSFPYVPTEDIVLYANNDTYASQIYKYYEVDSAVYPYLYFRYFPNGSTSSFLCFGSSITNDNKTIQSGFYYDLGKNLYISDVTDLESVTAYLCQSTFKNRTKTNITSASYYMNIYDQAGLVYYLNYDYTFSNSTMYRLDHVESEDDGNGDLPTDTLEGLTNGYDVMFYDENNEGLAFYSIKQGHSIEAPVYACKNWQTEDGATISFPYTPSRDVILYANNVSNAQQLYEYFDIDLVTYPYVHISQYNTGSGWIKEVYFIKKINGSSANSFNITGYSMAYVKDTTVLDENSDTYFDDLFNYIITLNPSMSTSSSTVMLSWTGTAFMNTSEYESVGAKNMDE